MITESDTRIEVVAVEGGADTLRTPRVAIPPELSRLADEQTQPIEPLSTAIRQRGYRQRVKARWHGSPLADWTRPARDPLDEWAGTVAVHTVRRWLRRRTKVAFVVGAVSGAVGLGVGYVLVASLVTAVLADMFGVAAHLIGGAS